MSKRPKFTVTLLHRFAGSNPKGEFSVVWWHDEKQYFEHDISEAVTFAYREVTNPVTLADEDYAIVISVRGKRNNDQFGKPLADDPNLQYGLFRSLCKIFGANRMLKRQAKALEADTEKGGQA